MEALPDTCLLAFKTSKNDKVNARGLEGAQTRIGDLLHRWPRRRNPQFGDEDDSSVARPLASTPERLELEAIETVPLLLDIIFKNFPAIEDCLKTFKKKCVCPECEGEGAPVEFCIPGYLRQSAVSYLNFLIGNTITDIFRIDDVSGMLQMEKYIVQVRLSLPNYFRGSRLVEYVVQFGSLYHSWIHSLAVSRFKSRSTIDESGSALVTVQYGSLIAATS